MAFAPKMNGSLKAGTGNPGKIPRMPFELRFISFVSKLGLYIITEGNTFISVVNFMFYTSLLNYFTPI